MIEKLRIGFIGIGMLGRPMSKRVLAAGYPLTVYDIKPEPVEELVRAGAKKASNPREIAEVSDIVLTSLPSITACEKVYLGDDGLLKGGQEGQIIVETSTVPPRMVKKFADEANKKGIMVVDAPLLARTTFHPGLSKLKSNEVADKGLMTVLMGGDDVAVEMVRPVLATFGDPIFHVGPLGSGQMIKVLSNATGHAYFVVACEILAVAAKAGVDIAKLEEIFRHTSARSYPLNDVMPYYLQNGTGKQMTLEVLIKDTESMLEIAREFNVPVLLQSVNHAYCEMALQRGGFKDEPWDAALMKLWESFVGKSIRF